jgi:mRNA interferase MazF
MRRGDFVTIALHGDFGKPRPALVIQSDHFEAHPTVTVLLVSSAMVEAPLLRVTVDPDASNGLRAPSQSWWIRR